MASRLEYFTMCPLNRLAYAAVGQVSVVDEYKRELDEQAKKARRLLRSRREQERQLPFGIQPGGEPARGGHLLLQTRTKVLNDELEGVFVDGTLYFGLKLRLRDPPGAAALQLMREAAGTS
jgi:hypothetical protein